MSAKDEPITNIELQSIGEIKSWFIRKNGTPRQSSICPESRGTLKIRKEIFNNPQHALLGIEEYSHVWIIYYFHKNSNKRCHAKVHPPRLNGKSCGVFASRSPHRPNPIGLSLAKIEKFEGDTLHLSGIDILDGTPVLDIKPFIQCYDSPEKTSEGTSNTIEPKIPEWVKGSEVPNSIVEFTERSLKELCKFHSPNTHSESLDESKCFYCLNYLNSSKDAQMAIVNVLRSDPRSVYRRQKCSDRLYYFIMDTIHITCWFDDDSNLAEVIRIKPYKA